MSNMAKKNCNKTFELNNINNNQTNFNYEKLVILICKTY